MRLENMLKRGLRGGLGNLDFRPWLLSAMLSAERLPYVVYKRLNTSFERQHSCPSERSIMIDVTE